MADQPTADPLTIQVPPETAVHDEAPTSSSTVATSIPDDPPQPTTPPADELVPDVPNVPEEPVVRAKDTTPPIDTFDWIKYLSDCDAIAAPDEYFAQSATPPINHFEEGMKLEMRDPRGGRETICLASVENTFEVWLCTRLEGCDNSNDRWLICDHEDLLPVGFAESLKSTVTPPIGYMYSMAKHKQFVDSKLQDRSQIARAECFTPIRPSIVPKENKFEVGQKLESVDIKNFSGTLYPSTITNVDGDMIDVNFDGYSQGYNIKVRFDSRDIFPAGWGARAGVPVTKPPKLRPTKKAAKRPVPVATAVDSTPTMAASKKSKIENTAVTAIKSVDRPRSRNKKPAAISPVPKPPSRASSSASIKPPPIKVEENTLTVYTNSDCACGPWLEPSKLTASYQNLVIGPYSIMHGVREVLQMVINSAMENRCQKVLEMFALATNSALPDSKSSPGGDDAVSVTASIAGATRVVPLPYVPDTESAWRLIDGFLDHLHTCPRLLSPTDAPCADCGRRVEPGTNAPPNSEPLPPWTDADTNRVIRWTVEEVAGELATLDDETVLSAIRQHAIDGQALFLLTTDLMVKYMGLKLGPALKVMEWRDNFKKSVANRRQQR